MLSQDYLTQRLVRLGPSEEWSYAGQSIVFLLVQRGTGKCISDKVTKTISAGDVAVLSVTSNSKVVASEHSEITFHHFWVRLEYLVALFSGTEICFLQSVTDSLRGVKVYLSGSPQAGECFKHLGDVPSAFSLAHRVHLLRIVAAILSEEFHQAKDQRSGIMNSDERVLQVFESLSSDDILNLSVEEMAAKFGCTRRHLNRLFHHHFGTSMAALKMEMRLVKAVALLQDPNAKIITIAEECGFNHLGLFNTCFKRRFGSSPGQWRHVKADVQKKDPTVNTNNSDCRMRKYGLCPWVDTSKFDLMKNVKSDMRITA